MARLGLISDIHANLEALEAVLADVARVDLDHLICLGDVVGYGPDPARCVELALDACDLIVIGNHEEAALRRLAVPRFNPNAQRSTDFTRGALSAAHLKAIGAWPRTACVESLSVTHASFGPQAHEYLYSPAAALRSLAGFDTPFGAVGHTHVPCAFAMDEPSSAPPAHPEASAAAPEPTVRACLPTGPALVSLVGAGRCLMNPGSVGQPRDKDPRASWAVLDTEARTFEVRRLQYDAQAVLHKIHRAGLPARLGERLLLGA